MTFLQIKYFVKVCECGSVTKAAKILHVSQPSISYAIRELEEKYQIELFDRSGNRMIPTRGGELLWKRSDEILKEWDQLELQMEKYCHYEIKIGMSPIIKELFGQQLLEEFKRIHPEIHITVVEIHSLEAVEKIQNGELDAAMIFWSAGAEEDLQIEIVGRLRGNALQEEISLMIGVLSKREKNNKKLGIFLKFAQNR